MGAIVLFNMLICMSVIILGLYCINSHAQTPQNVSIVYGNVNRHYQNETSTVYTQLCGESPVYYDYSPPFNSYVIVCREEDRFELRTFKIDNNLDREFAQTKRTLLNSMNPFSSFFFALDWIHGLFYFSRNAEMFVVDLTRNVSETLLLDRSVASSTILSYILAIVVRPELGELYWLEKSFPRYSRSRHSSVYKSTQSGKNIQRLDRDQFQNLEQLTFDYVSGRFMAAQRVNYTEMVRKVYIFENNNFNNSYERHFKINERDEEPLQVRLYNDTLYFTCVIWNEMGPPDYKLRYHNADSVFDVVNSTQFFGLVDYAGLLRPSLPPVCRPWMCQHDADDFCIANTLDTYVCRDDLDTVLFYGYWSALISMASVIFTTLAVLIILMSKKRSSLSRIRFRQTKRANSAKLEPETEATLEIAVNTVCERPSSFFLV